MFDTRVFTLRVFTDQNSVDVVVWCLETLDRDTRTNVGKKIERPTECQVEGDMTLADLVQIVNFCTQIIIKCELTWCCQGTLKKLNL